MSGTPRRRILKPGEQALRRQALSRGARVVTKDELRQIFTAARIEAKAANGELLEKILYSAPPSPLMGQPPDTLSQRIGYFDASGNKAAEIHRYLLSDGTLGGSGKPDPKEVVHNGIRYFLDVS